MLEPKGENGNWATCGVPVLHKASMHAVPTGRANIICLEMLAHPVRASFWERPNLPRGTFEQAC